MKRKILVVDDEESIRFTLSSFLREEGYETATAANYDEALRAASATDFDLFFVDIVMDGKTGIDLLYAVKKKYPGAQVVIITGAPSIETAAEAVRSGAFDYLVKPIRQSDILKAADIALRHKQLADEKEHYRANIEAIYKSVKDGIVTVDRDMRIVDINAAAHKICGFTTKNLSGLLFSEAACDCSRSCCELLKDILSHKKEAELGHVECHRHKGHQQIVNVSASPLLDSQGVFNGCVMVLRDESRLYHFEKQAQREISFNRLIGISPRMEQVKSLIRILAKVQTTVLIYGESGTGKELVVDALHGAGDRSQKPLIKVNCGALADGLLESELFGHVQGAYTGAVKERAGRFRMADCGTIFLDEIGDISEKMQLQLLRVLETMSFEKVGSSSPESVDVRVVAATNRDLADKVKAGQFRQDLYYRLKVAQLNMPALRDRKKDIPLLAKFFIDKFNRKFRKNIKAVSADVAKIFQFYSWPGNVRELENAIEYGSILCGGHIITVSDLPAEFYLHTPDSAVSDNTGDDIEVRAILEALEKTGGNKAKAARMLNISRRTMYRKIEKHSIVK